jgi:MoxR-like ATPase
MASRDSLQRFYHAVDTVLVGQRPLVDRLLIGLLTDGHILLEGLPGLAKTLAVRTVAAALHLQFSRIQFTPDLLPADLIGTQVYHPQTGTFSVKRGPIFANVVLADEINRAPAKVQSALLEAMQERQVTIADQSWPLPHPFFVLATQNPVEHEGTYPLPEAQVDRFLLKVLVSYPSRAEELAIIERVGSVHACTTVDPQLDPDELAILRDEVDRVHIEATVKEYLVDLVRATRSLSALPLDLPAWIQYGASPRGSLGLLRAAKALAYLRGRNYVVPDDVKQIAPDVLRHRIILTYEAEAEGLTPDLVIQQILDRLPVP